MCCFSWCAYVQRSWVSYESESFLRRSVCLIVFVMTGNWMVMELWWVYLEASLESRESQNMMRESDRGSYLTLSWCLCVCLRAWMCTKCFRAPTNCVYHTDHPSITLHSWTSCAVTRSWRGLALLDVVSSQWAVTENKCVCESHIFLVRFYVMKAVCKCGLGLYSMQNLRKDTTVYYIHGAYVNLELCVCSELTPVILTSHLFAN